ncbi:tyrosine-type recombinase/integrase [Vagococcus xieshaowenii]|uniref:Site-specific integrase n=1 Tax=Vagococcus xieshaowenii TaxID=2562451 RepID=A0A4Z0DD18_9ENTE|nr:site-specific integrase [Vagococcus xieshaowenii]QCA28411.1 site-specific integrase [Vagococcus xieshaowenii]TFZ42833.1 site-specific integrase [Vagococcus xieshaowenii]
MPIYLIERYKQTYQKLPIILQLFLDNLDTTLTTRCEYAETLEYLLNFMYLKHLNSDHFSSSITMLSKEDYEQFIQLTQPYSFKQNTKKETNNFAIQTNRKINIINHLLLFLYKQGIHSEHLILSAYVENTPCNEKNFLTRKEALLFWKSALRAEPKTPYQSAYDKLIRQRNLLIILLSLTMGISAKEISALKKNDLSIEHYEIFVSRGENKLENIPIPHYFREYFDTYWELVQHSASVMLFHCSNGNALTTKKIQNILTEINFRCGFQKSINISVLNNTFEQLLLEELKDPQAVEWASGKSDTPHLDIKKILLEIKLIDLDCL